MPARCVHLCLCAGRYSVCVLRGVYAERLRYFTGHSLKAMICVRSLFNTGRSKKTSTPMQLRGDPMVSGSEWEEQQRIKLTHSAVHLASVSSPFYSSRKKGKSQRGNCGWSSSSSSSSGWPHGLAHLRRTLSRVCSAPSCNFGGEAQRASGSGV